MLHLYTKWCDVLRRCNASPCTTVYTIDVLRVSCCTASLVIHCDVLATHQLLILKGIKTYSVVSIHLTSGLRVIWTASQIPHSPITWATAGCVLFLHEVTALLHDLIAVERLAYAPSSSLLRFDPAPPFALPVHPPVVTLPAASEIDLLCTGEALWRLAGLSHVTHSLVTIVLPSSCSSFTHSRLRPSSSTPASGALCG